MSQESDIAKLVEIVMKNILGKPVKAYVERDDVSKVLKVVMQGVDPDVFEPSLSAISSCVSDKIRNLQQNKQNVRGTEIYDCVDNYFSKNGTEFQDKIAPAALTMYENAFNQYASESEKETMKDRGGIKKISACGITNDDSSQYRSCLSGSETPKITWELVKRNFTATRESVSPLA